MPREFEKAIPIYNLVFNELSESTQLHVLLNGTDSCDLNRIKDFFTHPFVHFYTTPTNLGVAGGRNFLLREIEKISSVDFLIAFDNDLLFPSGYFERMKALYHRITQSEGPVGIIAPALVDGGENSAGPRRWISISG